MAKKAATMQERLEKMIAGANANADGPTIPVETFQKYVADLNALEYKVTQAKTALGETVKERDAYLAQVDADMWKAERAVESHFGRRAARLKDYILEKTTTMRKAATTQQ